MSHNGILMLMLSTLAACSAAGEPGQAPRPPLVLSPEPALEAATIEAADAWIEATGLEIFVGPGGIPVRVDNALNACGSTYVRRFGSGEFHDITSVDIRVVPPAGNFCRPPSGTLRHEIAHVLRHGASLDAAPEGPEHATHGLFSEAANPAATIDEPALELVCGVADCARMRVEAQ